MLRISKVLRITKVMLILRKVAVDHRSVMECTKALRMIQNVASVFWTIQMCADHEGVANH